MENEVVREDGDVTQRRAWTAAEAAAHPALGIRPGKSVAPLARVPRASVAPAPASETVVTPAPRFDDVPHVEDPLDDLLELSSQMLVDEPDLDESFVDGPGLSDDDVELLADDLLEEVDESMEVGDAEVLEEIDSGLLAYVETRGEITEKPHRIPSGPDREVSSVSLASLAESLHNQALASGMATYSNGVPTHALDHGPASGKTLPIRTEPRASRVLGASSFRNGLFAVVFLAGIGAGVFFGMPSATPATAPASTSSAALVAPQSAAGVMVVPNDEHEAETSAPATVAVTSELAGEFSDQVPVVAPLIETATVDTANVETATDDAPAEIDVQPLDESTLQGGTREPAGIAEPDAVVDDHEEPAVVEPAKKARIRATTNLPPGDLAVTGHGDPGVLMLGAKPPCEIQIDGKDTGLTTPQRVLRLPPGKHKVTLVNQEHDLRETFRVSIRSGHKTRVVRDMTSKIK